MNIHNKIRCEKCKMLYYRKHKCRKNSQQKNTLSRKIKTSFFISSADNYNRLPEVLKGRGKEGETLVNRENLVHSNTFIDELTPLADYNLINNDDKMSEEFEKKLRNKLLKISKQKPELFEWLMQMPKLFPKNKQEVKK